MWPNFARMILLLLHAAQSQEEPKAPQELDLIVAAPGDTVQIRCSLPPGFLGWGVMWYKEQWDRKLHKIYQSYSNWEPKGKYSGRAPNLTISDVQRNYSGVYYCASASHESFRILSAARLIITDTPRPRQSILAPFALEGTPPNQSIPLLCLTFDANPAWDNFSWDVSEESSGDRRGVGVIDEDGGFSIWHFQMIPLEEGTEEEASSCSLPESRSTKAVTSTSQGNCIYSLYFRIPSIIILLVPPMILVFKKCRAREHSDEAENQTPKREILQQQE